MRKIVRICLMIILFPVIPFIVLIGWAFDKEESSYREAFKYLIEGMYG